jgi:hypothetical protein
MVVVVSLSLKVVLLHALLLAFSCWIVKPCAPRSIIRTSCILDTIQKKKLQSIYWTIIEINKQCLLEADATMQHQWL